MQVKRVRFSGLLPVAPLTDKMSDFKAEVEKLFHELDKDKSGKISAAEMKAALQSCSDVPINDEHVKLFIEKVDANGDGELSLDELMKLLQ